MFVRPSHGRERPEPGGCPSVENVFILLEAVLFEVFTIGRAIKDVVFTFRLFHDRHQGIFSNVYFLTIGHSKNLYYCRGITVLPVSFHVTVPTPAKKFIGPVVFRQRHAFVPYGYAVAPP